MGFTESSHPELRAQAQALLPQDKASTKEDEDEIVSSLLEQLLLAVPERTTSREPVASGSDVRNASESSIPGEWQG